MSTKPAFVGRAGQLRCPHGVVSPERCTDCGRDVPWLTPYDRKVAILDDLLDVWFRLVGILALLAVTLKLCGCSSNGPEPYERFNVSPCGEDGCAGAVSYMWDSGAPDAARDGGAPPRDASQDAVADAQQPPDAATAPDAAPAGAGFCEPCWQGEECASGACGPAGFCSQRCTVVLGEHDCPEAAMQCANYLSSGRWCRPDAPDTCARWVP